MAQRSTSQTTSLGAGSHSTQPGGFGSQGSFGVDNQRPSGVFMADQADESAENASLKARMKKRAKSAIIVLLDTVLMKSEPKVKWVVFITVLRLVQMLSLVLDGLLVRSNTLQLSVLARVLSYSTGRPWMHPEMPSYPATRLWAVFVLNIAWYLMAGYQRRPIPMLLKHMRRFIFIVCHVLYIPVLVLLALPCEIPGAICVYSGNEPLLSLFTSINAMFFIAAVWCANLTLYPNEFTLSDSPRFRRALLAQSNGRYAALLAVVQLLVLWQSVLQTRAPHDVQHGIIGGALTVGLVALPLLALLLFQPYISQVMNAVQSGLITVVLYAAVLRSLRGAEAIDDYMSALLLYAAALPVFIGGGTASVVLLHAYWRFLASRDDAQRFIPTPMHLELALRRFDAWVDSQGSVSSNPATTASILTGAQAIFDALDDKWAESAWFHFAQALFKAKWSGNAQHSTTEMTKAMRCKPWLDTVWVLHRLEADRSKLYQSRGDDVLADERGGTVDLATALDHRRQLDMALRVHLRAVKSIRSFWRAMTRSEIDFQALQRISNRINEDAALADGIYVRMLKLHPNNVSLLRGYASFQDEVRNNPFRAEELYTRAKDLADISDKAAGQDARRDHNLLDPRDILDNEKLFLVMDGTSRIVMMSPAAAAMLGGTRRDMIGKNLASLLPPPFDQTHQGFMAQASMSGQEKMLNKPGGADLVFRKLTGTLASVHMNVSSTYLASGPAYAATFRPEEQQSGQCIVYVLRSTSRAIGCNTAAEAMLGYSSTELDGRHVSQIIPSFTETQWNKGLKVQTRAYNNKPLEAASTVALGRPRRGSLALPVSRAQRHDGSMSPSSVRPRSVTSPASGSGSGAGTANARRAFRENETASSSFSTSLSDENNPVREMLQHPDATHNLTISTIDSGNMVCSVKVRSMVAGQVIALCIAPATEEATESASLDDVRLIDSRTGALPVGNALLRRASIRSAGERGVVGSAPGVGALASRMQSIREKDPQLLESTSMGMLSVTSEDSATSGLSGPAISQGRSQGAASHGFSASTGLRSGMTGTSAASQASSNRKYRKLHQELRKHNTSDTNGLSQLRIVTIMVVLLLAAQAIYSEVLFGLLLEDAKSSVGYIRVSSTREAIASHLASDVWTLHDLVNVANASLVPDPLQHPDIPMVQQRIQSRLNELAEAQVTLFNGNQELFYLPKVDLRVLRSGTGASTDDSGFGSAYDGWNGTLVHRRVNMWDALTELAMNAQVTALNQNLDMLQGDYRDHEALSFVTLNGPISVAQAATVSSELYMQSMFATLSNIQILSVVGIVLLLWMSIALTWCSMRPTVGLVSREKRSTIAFFMDMDQQTLKTLAATRSAHDENDSDEEQANSDIEDGGYALLQKAEGAATIGGSGAGSNADKAGGGKESTQGRDARFTSTSDNAVHYRYIGVAMTFFVLFTVLYASQLRLVPLGYRGAIDMHTASRRQGGVAEVAYWTHYVVSESHVPKSDAQTQLKNAVQTARLLEDHLLFGHESSNDDDGDDGDDVTRYQPEAEGRFRVNHVHVSDVGAEPIFVPNAAGMVHEYPEQDEIHFDPLCNRYTCSADEAADVATSNGLHALLLSFYDAADQVAMQGDTTALTVDDASWSRVEGLVESSNVMEAALSDSVDQLFTYLHSMIQGARSSNQLALFIILFGLFAGYTMAYLPMLRFLMSETKSIKFMVTLLPLTVLESNRNLRRRLAQVGTASADNTVWTREQYRKHWCNMVAASSYSKGFKTTTPTSKQPTKSALKSPRGNMNAGGAGKSGMRKNPPPVPAKPIPESPLMAPRGRRPSVTYSESLVALHRRKAFESGGVTDSGFFDPTWDPEAGEEGEQSPPHSAVSSRRELREGSRPRQPSSSAAVTTLATAAPKPILRTSGNAATAETRPYAWERVAVVTRRGRLRQRVVATLAGLCLLHTLLWYLPVMASGNHWHVLSDYKLLTVSMMVDSAFSGGSPIGGGALAYPVMRYVLQIDERVMRDVGYMTQTIGMLTTLVLMWTTGVPLETTVLTYGAPACFLGSYIGIGYLTGLVPQDVGRTLETSIWLSLGIAVMLLRRRAARASDDMSVYSWRVESVTPTTRYEIMCFGVIGGLISAQTSAGCDTVMYALMHLWLRMDIRAAIPTSVAMGGLNAAFSFAFRSFQDDGISDLGYDLMLAAFPTVVLFTQLASVFAANATTIQLLGVKNLVLFLGFTSSTVLQGSDVFLGNLNFMNILLTTSTFYMVGVGGSLRYRGVSLKYQADQEG